MRGDQNHQRVPNLQNNVANPDRLTEWNIAQDIPQTRHWRPYSSPRHVSSPLPKHALRGRLNRSPRHQPPAIPTTPPSPPSTHSSFDYQHFIEAKRQQRQERRNLREAGDWLGVQGAHPQTGIWDTTSPSTTDLALAVLTAKLEKFEKGFVASERERSQARYTASHVQTESESQRDVRTDKEDERIIRDEQSGQWRFLSVPASVCKIIVLVLVGRYFLMLSDALFDLVTEHCREGCLVLVAVGLLFVSRESRR